MRRTLVEVLVQKQEVAHAIGPDVPLSEARRLMGEHGLRVLSVVDDGVPVGVVVANAVAWPDETPLMGSAGELERPVHHIMVRPLCVAAETPVDEALWMMARQRCAYLVVTSGDELLGCLTLGDLARTFVDSVDRLGVRRARDPEIDEAIAEECVRQSGKG